MNELFGNELFGNGFSHHHTDVGHTNFYKIEKDDDLTNIFQT